MNTLDIVNRWKNDTNLEHELYVELQNMTSEQLEDAFYKNLEFGTGGMRGEIGVGTNRMNIYTIRKASAGLANFLISKGEEAMKRGVTIAYDSRHKSKEFAEQAAITLASNGIKVYLFDELRPTPMLSFALRYLHAYAGIVITASHNPPEYNGYKVYGPDGAQLTSADAEELVRNVQGIQNELDIIVEHEDALIKKGLIKTIGDEIDSAYIEKLMSISQRTLADSNISVVYTPLHGTGNKPVQRALQALKVKNFSVVEEQRLPDPNFSTVKSPNPEEQEAFQLAIHKGKETNADLLIATDPDADRLGIAVKDNRGDYKVLTGNQTGALMLHYILSERSSQNTLPENAVMLKTIVTSELGKSIAQSFNVKTIDVLTGFKYIAEWIKNFEETGSHQFIFGYEESFGYLIGDFVRDKDAIQAAVIVTEMCAYYKDKGLSLYQALEQIYREYGYYTEGMRSLTLKGKQGAEEISEILTLFRQKTPQQIAGLQVVKSEDYLTGIRTIGRKTEKIELPKSNVLKYFLEDDSWVCLRPSGTEPKIKFYFGTRAETFEDSTAKLMNLEEHFMCSIEEKLELIRK